MSYIGRSPISVDINNALLNEFSELLTSERTNQFQIKSSYGLSELRNITTEISGAVTASNGLINVYTSGASPDGFVKLSTSEFGRYVPGSIAEATVGIRFDPDSLADQRWGLFNPEGRSYSEGIGFGYNAASGLYLWTKKSGHETVIQSGSFNTISSSRLDDLNLNSGHIYRIRYAWYGYGAIIWEMQLPVGNVSERVSLHSFVPSDGTSINEPNQPVSVTIDNAGSPNASGLVYVSGRTYGVYGKSEAESRIVSEKALSKSVSNSVFVPILSFRRKAGKYQSLNLRGMDIDSNEKLLVQIRINSGPTTASWSTPSGYLPNETAGESDVSSTAVSATGIIIYEALVPESTKQTSALSSISIPVNIPATSEVTIMAKSLATTATADFIVRWVEEW